METALSFIVLLSLCPRPHTVIEGLLWLFWHWVLFHYTLPEENLCASCNYTTNTCRWKRVSQLTSKSERLWLSVFSCPFPAMWFTSSMDDTGNQRCLPRKPSFAAQRRPWMEDDDVRAHNHGSAYVTTFAYPSVLCCLAGWERLIFYGHLQQIGCNTAGVQLVSPQALKQPVLFVGTNL